MNGTPKNLIQLELEPLDFFLHLRVDCDSEVMRLQLVKRD